MTRLEKARELKPGWTDEQIIEYCPWRFFNWPQAPEKSYWERLFAFRCHDGTRIEQGETFEQWIERICRPCWNKQYKEEMTR